jgi:hypothetical protein
VSLKSEMEGSGWSPTEEELKLWLKTPTPMTASEGSGGGGSGGKDPKLPPSPLRGVQPDPLNRTPSPLSLAAAEGKKPAGAPPSPTAQAAALAIRPGSAGTSAAPQGQGPRTTQPSPQAMVAQPQSGVQSSAHSGGNTQNSSPLGGACDCAKAICNCLKRTFTSGGQGGSS